MSIAAKTQEDTTSVMWKYQILSDTEEPMCHKNFDETEHFQPKNSEEWIREVKGEGLHGIVNGWCSVLYLRGWQPFECSVPFLE